MASIEAEGNNSVSLAMEMGRISLVLGEEHTLRIFHEGHSACTPIRVGCRIQTYVVLTFPVEIDPAFATSITEKRLQAGIIDTDRESAYKKFEANQLINQQKEVHIRGVKRRLTIKLQNAWSFRYTRYGPC
ncbi:hypothetical protein C8Z91_23105 [Paenibacillus elgii]|uniref:Uncharacterized protein n=1 Tax=Paenibacillus elgii TaxID=189691 RepID=A0A2T6FY95_9BACL|nr:hypothetical protein C8Z91_23105 [Paenibacillus elgii]